MSCVLGDFIFLLENKDVENNTCNKINHKYEMAYLLSFNTDQKYVISKMAKL